MQASSAPTADSVLYFQTCFYRANFFVRTQLIPIKATVMSPAYIMLPKIRSALYFAIVFSILPKCPVSITMSLSVIFDVCLPSEAIFFYSCKIFLSPLNSFGRLSVIFTKNFGLDQTRDNTVNLVFQKSLLRTVNCTLLLHKTGQLCGKRMRLLIREVDADNLSGAFIHPSIQIYVIILHNVFSL